MARSTDFTLTLDLGAGADAAELEDATLAFRNELLELDAVADVSTVGTTAPPGAKAVEAVAVGVLLVKYGPRAIDALARFFDSWLKRDAERTITVEMPDGTSIALTGATNEERRELIDLWRRRQEQLLESS